MAYLRRPIGAGGRALAAAAALVIHTAAGAALVAGLDVQMLKPIERRTLTGISLPPPPPQPRTAPNPTSEGVPGKLYEPETAAATAPVRDAMSWIVPEQDEPEAGNPELDPPPPVDTTGSGTGCHDCGWWPENDWQYYQPGEPYRIALSAMDAGNNARLAAVPAVPANDPATWFEAEEDPRDPRSAADEAVRYTLSIGTEGQVLSCEVFEPSSGTALTRATCRAIQARARFNPATGWDGTPVTGAYNGTVRWKIAD